MLRAKNALAKIGAGGQAPSRKGMDLGIGMELRKGMDLAQQPEAEPTAAGKENENAGPLAPARMPDPSPRTMMRRRNLAVGQETIIAGPGAKAYTRVVVPKTGDELALIYNAFADKPLFAKLDSEQLTQVASIMTKAAFKQGDPLMAEGEQGDTFFILRSGSCSVTMGRRQVRARSHCRFALLFIHFIPYLLQL